ncbi:Sm protein [Trichomonas vaginalis G3]|uniref:Sm protein n=1 Tax=Trichomonas vaginalis (strain ATCC PRA-98 / G3) TaxID=412133 RepID=A2D7P7_TRIV3|nr:U6 snRNA-associated [Trichomonas vaginalis G3]EAY23764.1 Sm protein [Trichomonas vaginalis G3]KAI5490276.1 U6 snRNA-associated [Trichomonas vaginalis G3]|eukprot:XP_001277012.1 Sm protein [Trichomonas vaginalis G3]
MSADDAMTGFLQATLQKPTHVVLSTGSQLVGTLCTIDALFNLVLRDAVEMSNGNEVGRYQSIFIRGNQVIHVATAD